MCGKLINRTLSRIGTPYRNSGMPNFPSIGRSLARGGAEAS